MKKSRSAGRPGTGAGRSSSTRRRGRPPPAAAESAGDARAAGHHPAQQAALLPQAPAPLAVRRPCRGSWPPRRPSGAGGAGPSAGRRGAAPGGPSARLAGATAREAELRGREALPAGRGGHVDARRAPGDRSMPRIALDRAGGSTGTNRDRPFGATAAATVQSREGPA